MKQKIYKCSRCAYIWRVSDDKKPVYCPKCYQSSIFEIKKKSIFEKLKFFEKRKIKNKIVKEKDIITTQEKKKILGETLLFVIGIIIIIAFIIWIFGK